MYRERKRISMQTKNMKGRIGMNRYLEQQISAVSENTIRRFEIASSESGRIPEEAMLKCMTDYIVAFGISDADQKDKDD